MKNRLPSIRKIITFICFALAIVFVGVSIQKFNGTTDINGHKNSGYKPVIVITGSMVPAIEINSVSLMSYCTIDDLEVGDILMYRDPKNHINITHRVINVEKDVDGKTLYVNTKGDANERVDSINITNSLVIGKIVKTYNWVAPYLSRLMIAPGELNSAALIQVILSIAVALTLITLVLYNIINISISLIMSGKSKIKYTKYAESYEDELMKNIDNIEKLKELKDANGFKARVLRAMAIREIKAFGESSKDFNKVMKKVRNISKKDTD